MSEDITYCGYHNCTNKECERHSSNIKNKHILHSFTYFEDCPTHQKALDDLKAEIEDIED